MNTSDRRIVEAMKVADHITIQVNAGGELITLHCRKDKKLFHDLALAYQTAVITKERREERERFNNYSNTRYGTDR